MVSFAKYNSGNPDFEILPRMIELHKEKKYGTYAQDGDLWVCFTALTILLVVILDLL